MIEIGINALNKHFTKFKVSNKIEYIGTEEEISYWISDKNIKHYKRSINGFTFYTCNYKNNDYLFEVLLPNTSTSDYLELMNNEENVIKTASLEVLFSICKARINYYRDWNKQIEIYHFLKSILLQDHLSSITMKRKLENNYRYNLIVPSLKQTAQEFVEESQEVLNRMFDHDDIHIVMAHYEEPLYFKMLGDNEEVFCMKDKWDEFSYEDKLKCTLEEAYVLALERKIIPMLYQQGNGCSNKKAIMYSLMKICTTLASGWFRDFAVDNYYKLVEKADMGYVKKFVNAYKQDKVLKYQY